MRGGLHFCAQHLTQIVTPIRGAESSTRVTVASVGGKRARRMDLFATVAQQAGDQVRGEVE